ncbi:MAG: twin-arginine translocase subunit TatC [Planctomycetota bacterium]
MSDREEDPLIERGTMTFSEHLEELRRRIIISILATAVTTLAFLFAKNWLMNIVIEPYKDMWVLRALEWKEDVYDRIDRESLETQGQKDDYDLIARNWERIVGFEELPHINLDSLLERSNFKLKRGLISITPLQDFLTFMMAALIAGIVVASPIVLVQMWRFIGAGLYKAERRTVMRYVPASCLLFLAGALFGYVIMVPYALLFLTGMGSPLVDFTLTVRDYFKFLFLLTVALGFVFQLPVVMLVLTKVGICTPAVYIKYWRHAILTMFVLGAVFTPPDPFTQVLMAGPMILLYGLGLVLSQFVHKKQQAVGA